MASIDKTYVNWEEYKQVREFFTKEIKAQIKKDLGFSFTYWKQPKKFEGEVPIWNTPTIVDMWLAKNCPLKCIQDRLHEQYPENWIGWLDLNFNELGFLVRAESKNGYIAPFNFKPLENEVEIFEEIVFFGTTYFLKFFDEVITGVCRGEFYKLDSEGLEVDFEIFGLILSYKGGKYFIEDKEVTYGYFPTSHFRKDCFDKFFMPYKIKHSYRKDDFLKYEPEQIVMSHENECFNVDVYKDFDKENYKKYLGFLPKYINIK